MFTEISADLRPILQILKDCFDRGTKNPKEEVKSVNNMAQIGRGWLD